MAKTDLQKGRMQIESLLYLPREIHPEENVPYTK